MSLKPYPAYKESGVAWLGQVPEHWQVKRLKRVVTLNPSKSEINHLSDSTELSFLAMEAIGENGELDLTKTRPIFDVLTGYSFFANGDVIFAKVTPCFENGKGALLDGLTHGFGFGTTEVTVLRPNSPDDAGYIWWLIASDFFRRPATAEMLGAGGLKRVPDQFVADFAVAWPPHQERNALKSFLDLQTRKIDELIAEQEKLIALLAEKRQATTFHAVTKGLNPAAPMKDSGVEWLGQIPAHWTVLRIADHFCEVSEPGIEELPVLSVSIHDGVSDDELSPDEVERKVTRSEDRTKYKRVAPNDLVYNMMRAWQGGFGTVQVEGMVSPAYVVARPKSQTPTQFIEYILRTQNAVQEMKRYSKGVTDFRLRLYWNEFKNIKIGFAPPQEQAEILGFIEKENFKLSALAEEANRVIDLLKERRTALISDVVTGKIDVRQPSAEIIDLAVARRRLRGLLAVELIEKAQGRATFGRTALQKHAYLAEAFAGVHELGGRYIRNDYGPLDRDMIDDMESEAQALCGIVTQPPTGTNRSVTYLLSRQTGTISNELAQQLGPDRSAKLQRLHALLASLNTHDVEGVATLFAVWNDFLIEHDAPTDDDIVNGFLNDWHPKKSENFTAQELHLRLKWMRDHHLVPTGTGPKTETGRLFV